MIKLIKLWWKQLWCIHDFEFYDVTLGGKDLYKCTKCDKIEAI